MGITGRARVGATGVTAVALVALVGLVGLPRGTNPMEVPASSSEAAVARAAGTQALPGGRLTEQQLDPLDPPAGRPSLNATHPDENPHTIPGVRTTPDWVSGVVFDQQVVLGDVALPWTYWLDPAVPETVDEPTVHHAVGAWDIVPGSRWASAFAGYRPSPGPIADGHSTIFMEVECGDLTTANAYLFTDGGLGVDRYGTTATQILEADIGICPRVVDSRQLARAVTHEIGHVVGLAHLCDPGEECWEPAMGEGPHDCTVMFWQARSCQSSLSPGEQAATVALYPTLRRLAGPDATEATARASFAVIDDGAAPLVVVVTPETPASLVAAAATLAGRAGGSLLLAAPTVDRCLDGSAARETNRSLARRGTLVLVGQWPQACSDLAYDWDVGLRHVPEADPGAGAIAVAELGGPATGAVLVGAGAPVAELLAAASLAAGRGQPLLLVDGGGLTEAVGARLQAGGATAVTVVGGTGSVPAAAEAGLPGIEVTRLDAGDPVATALVVADVQRAEGRDGIVLAAPTGGEAFAAVAVAARDSSAVVGVGPDVDPQVLGWLGTTLPPRGWALGDEAQLPPATLAAYAALIPG